MSEPEPRHERLAAEHRVARESILAVMRPKPYVVWTPDVLRQRANATGPVGMYATTKLVSDGILILDSHLRVSFPLEYRRNPRAAA